MDLGVKPLSYTTSNVSLKSNDVVSDMFPAGLRVLVVDDDPTCLRILEKMLKNCLYEVTTCNRAELALKFLRDNRNGYDVVISDVHMPDMDGFKLLEHIGLEMDLPVIMMSADDSKSVVMKGVTHGACDYLIKPVRMEALKNIWQHVVRKKKYEWKDNNNNKDYEQSGSVDDLDRQQKQNNEDVDYSSSANEGNNWKNSKRRKDDEDEGDERDDSSTLKKPRVVWSVELHQQFVTAVNHLGIDKAVPKKILELMNVPGLTRENVASHLQKYRLYLRRLSGVQHQNGLTNSFMGPSDMPFGSMSSLNGVDFQALAASGQLPPQSLATIQAASLGRAHTKPSIPLPLVDQRNIFSFENPKSRFVESQTQNQSQQQNNNPKQVNHLLHGIPTNMDSKQLASLHHQSANSFNNMNMHNHVMQMGQGQPHPRSQLLTEVNGSDLPSSSSSVMSQPVLSQGNIPTSFLGSRNGIISSLPQPSTVVNFTNQSSDFGGAKLSGDFAPPNYDVFNDMYQNNNRAQEWRVRNAQGGLDVVSPSVLVQQRFSSSSNQKSVGQNNRVSSVVNDKMGFSDIGQQINSSLADNQLRIKAERLPDMGFQNGLFPQEHFGQDDLMAALLKQQQEGVGPVESEFGFDGYHLDNLPV